MLLQDLPLEVIIHIVSLLEVRDFLALRRSHKSIYSISQDRFLWRNLLRNLHPPLPRTLRSRHLESLSYPELEEVLFRSYRAEHQWLKRHESSLALSPVREGTSPCLLDFLDDRWIISIPSYGPPMIWDARKNPPKLCELTSHSYETQDAAVAVDPRQGDIVIVLRGESGLRMLRAHQTGLRRGYLQLTDHGTISDPGLGKVLLEPSRSAVISGFIRNGIEIHDWTRNRSVTVNITRANNDREKEPILGLCLVGDYALSFRVRQIELSRVPLFPDGDTRSASEHNPTTLPFHLKHLLLSSASLSEPQSNPESLDNSRIIYVLAHQLSVGFFYFRVTIYDPDYTPSGPGASMDVDLIGVYYLIRSSLITSVPRLGPEGKRGFWIELSFKEFERRVVAASFDQTRSAGIPVKSGDDLQELRKITPRIESTAEVFVIPCSRSCDGAWTFQIDYASIERLKYLPDAILRCAFSESTGEIVLETQDRGIILLRQ